MQKQNYTEKKLLFYQHVETKSLCISYIKNFSYTDFNSIKRMRNVHPGRKLLTQLNTLERFVMKRT